MKTKACFFLFFCFAFAANGQKTVVIEKQAVYKPFGDFFQKHNKLTQIIFSKDRIYDLMQLEMITEDFDSTFFNGLNRFDLSNKGDRYFFKKQYGDFDIPDSLYNKWIDRKADVTSISGKIIGDSIFFTLTATYPKKKVAGDEDEDMVFVKVEKRVDYQKGLPVLAQELQTSLYAATVLANDSVFIARCLIEKTGILVIDKIEKGFSENAYTKALVNALNSSGPWIPYETCGSKVRAYKKIYVRINPDKTYLVALQ